MLPFLGCTHGEIRLAGGTGDGQSEGRVEICLNNEWGTVCDQMWDDIDAGVVCRQLHLDSNGMQASMHKAKFLVNFDYITIVYVHNIM